MKTEQRLKAILIAVAGAVPVAVLLTAPIQAKPFNPAAVQSRECQAGQFKCGFNPVSEEVDQAVPVADSTLISHRGLPSRADISSEMPPVINQGQQNSCVAFSVGYYTRSYLEHKQRNSSYDSPVTGGQGERVFSPAFIYNQINGGKDNGSYFNAALDVVTQKGAAPWKTMPYSDKDYRTQPSAQVISVARNYKAESYRRVPFDNLEAIKSELSEGRPIIFGITIDDNFYNLGDAVYDATGGRTYGGHAMTLVGYDDSKKSPRGDKGAFKIINSWGKDWGDNGFGWISYRQWVAMRPYAYVLYPAKGTSTTPTSTNETTTTTTTTPSENVTQDVSGIQAPDRVQASQGSYPDRVEVGWTGVTGAMAYGVFRAEPGSDRFAFIGYANGTSYADRKIQAGTTYRYRVVSISDEQTSELAQSPIASGYSAAGGNDTGGVPSAVTQVQAELRGQAGAYSVVINWNNAPGATYYQIRRFDPSANKWLTWGQKLQTNSFSDPSPIANTVNRYSVRAGNTQGLGPWSDPTSTAVPGTSTVPPAPSGLIVSNGLYRDHIALRWTAAPGAKKYYVFRYDYGTKKWGTAIDAGSSSSFEDKSTDVSDGRPYAYTLVAVNEAGASEYASPVVGRTNPNVQRAGEVLEAPTGIEAKLDSSGKVTITWKSVPKSDEYYVYRKVKGDKNYTFAGSTDGKTTTYSEKYPGKPGDLYLYTVRSKPGMGQESPDGRPAAVFVNAQTEAVAHRFMPGQGLDRFSGTWNGRYWDGKGAPRQIKLIVEGDGGLIRLRLSDDHGGNAGLTGNYPAMADEVRLKGVQVTFRENLDVLILRGDEDFAFLPGQTVSFVR